MNRYPSIGRVGVLALTLGVGGVTLPAGATPLDITPPAVSRAAVALTPVTPTLVTPGPVAPVVSALQLRQSPTVPSAPTYPAISQRFSLSSEVRVVVPESVDTATLLESLTGGPGQRDHVRAASRSLRLDGDRDEKQGAPEHLAGAPTSAGPNAVAALIGVFIGNGDEPGENGGLLIGNGAPGAPGQDGGRGGLLFGNGGRGGDGLTGQDGGNGGAAGLFGVFAIREPGLLWLPMIGVGFAWASIVSMPYAILSAAVPDRKMGVYMGVFNIFIVVPQLLAATGEMLQAAVAGGLTIATTPRPLREVATAWPLDDSQKRTVFVVD